MSKQLQNVANTARLESWAQFIESEKLNSNRENIEVYVVNLDVFSIGNQCFTFNELDSEMFLRIA